MPDQRPCRGITEDGKWVKGWYAGKGLKYDRIIPTIGGYGSYFNINKHKSMIGPVIEVIPETVGQSTGLKDKNGKDLDWWEGDIYEFYLYGRFVITFIEGAFMFVPEGWKFGKVNHLCNEVTIWVTQPTKAGTIHDHLLKSKENHND